MPDDFPNQGLIAMRLMIALIPLTLLAACGADGLPVAPSQATASTSGIAITGQAQIGIVGGN